MANSMNGNKLMIAFVKFIRWTVLHNYRGKSGAIVYSLSMDNLLTRD